MPQMTLFEIFLWLSLIVIGYSISYIRKMLRARREFKEFLINECDKFSKAQDMICRDCGTTENVGESGLCSFCEEEEEEHYLDDSEEEYD